MRSTDKIRFYILKTLKDFPDLHGYNLYLMLEKQKLVKNASQLYKILNAMENKGLITSRESQSDKGPNKKELQITKLGKEAYYLEVIEHFKIVTDFIGEAMFRVERTNDPEASDFLINLLNAYNKKIYLDLRNIPSVLMNTLVIQVLIPLVKKGNNTVYIDKLAEDPIFPIKNLIREHVIILDENLGLNPDSIDLIVVTSNQLSKPFVEKYKQCKTILNHEGHMIIVHFDIRKRNKDHDPPGLRKIFKFLANELPEKYSKLLSLQIFPYTLEEPDDLPELDFDEFIEILKADFGDVDVTEENQQIKIIDLKEKR